MPQTRDEFLDRFCERMGISKHYRTPDGIKLGSFHRVAVECERGPAEHTHYLGYSMGATFDCPGWVLIEPPRGDKSRGGEYKMTDHRNG